jgi:hypothetical protein
VSWIGKAVCSKDANPSYWVSYNLDKIEYAKNGCAKCTVKKQCMASAYSFVDNVNIFEHSIAGVIAGISEYERKIMAWKKVNDINGNNWE